MLTTLQDLQVSPKTKKHLNMQIRRPLQSFFLSRWLVVLHIPFLQCICKRIAMQEFLKQMWYSPSCRRILMRHCWSISLLRVAISFTFYLHLTGILEQMAKFWFALSCSKSLSKFNAFWCIYCNLKRFAKLKWCSKNGIF